MATVSTGPHIMDETSAFMDTTICNAPKFQCQKPQQFQLVWRVLHVEVFLCPHNSRFRANISREKQGVLDSYFRFSDCVNILIRFALSLYSYITRLSLLCNSTICWRVMNFQKMHRRISNYTALTVWRVPEMEYLPMLTKNICRIFNHWSSGIAIMIIFFLNCEVSL